MKAMNRRLLIVSFLIIILVAAVFLFFRSGFREGLAVLKIEAPETAASGEEIEYKIKIQNKNKVDLVNIKLSFFYPSNSIPLNEEGRALSSLINNFDLNVLKKGEEKEFILKAIITGEKGEIKKAKASLAYTPSTIRSVFQKNEEAATTISKLSFPMTLSAPPNVLPGQKVSVSLDIRNETEKDFEGLRIVFSYPNGFNFRGANPFPGEDGNIFNISSLKSNEGIRITVEGEISGFEKEGKRFTAALRKKIGEEYFDIQKIHVLTTVSTPLLTTEVLVNDKKDYIAAAGDRSKYTIKFSNNSTNNFSALELNAKLEGQMFDFASLKTSGFFNQNSQTILWNAAAESLLANLAPNQSGEVSFEINLKQNFPKVFAKNYSLKVSSLIQTSSVPPNFNLDKISASAELISKIRTDADFISQAFYGDSAFPNSGPVPPRVGQKTTYTIHWKITNEGNDLTNVKIMSFLLPGISWENKFKVTPTQSDLNYNSSTGQISWAVPTVPAGTGTVSPVFEAAFQVGLTPGPNQASQTVEILKEAAFEGVDNFTKESIKINQARINTQTVSDAPGVVQPQ